MIILWIVLVGCSLITNIVLASHTNVTSTLKDIPFLDKFQQNDYNLTFERLEPLRYDKQYVKFFNIVTFKYNRTCAVANSSVLYNVDIGNDLEVIVQMYKFASNEYRPFPARFQLNACHAIEKNVMGSGEFRNCGNFECPLVKGKKYVICNFSPNAAMFPPLIPNGQYMMEFQAILNSIELVVFRGYGIIFRPIPIL